MLQARLLVFEALRAACTRSVTSTADGENTASAGSMSILGREQGGLRDIMQEKGVHRCVTRRLDDTEQTEQKKDRFMWALTKSLDGRYSTWQR